MITFDPLPPVVTGSFQAIKFATFPKNKMAAVRYGRIRSLRHMMSVH
jgi:hypothetical protein